MKTSVDLNFDWEFVKKFDDAFMQGAKTDVKRVDIPHTCVETPFNYFDESVYQMVMGYRKKVRMPEDLQKKRVFLVIDGAAHSSQVYVNGMEAGDEHRCGYTSFEREITDLVDEGRDALICIRVNSREDQNIPPFGHAVDYMTYGGIYREIRLEIRDETYIENVFYKPEISGELKTEIIINGYADSIVQEIYYDGDLVAKGSFDIRDDFYNGEISLKVDDVRLWDTKQANLYNVKTGVIVNGKTADTDISKIGFREIRFETDGFYLNGRRVKILGINRHQSYPYVGYAMPKSMQRYDAQIIKNELGFNAVRTSHYPQSQHFLDACDELGLMVFTEIPGWQHIGNDQWKDTALENVKEMVTQYRNHPSIILWGVRINESVDDDLLYSKTNDAAHFLDPTRPTGGVRCYKKSSFLEDVYTYNDFSFDGEGEGCEDKDDVTSDINRPYLISEYNGHMFPTKPYDDEDHRLEHALRHARVLDSVASKRDILGSFAWCFFDYNTHRDFGAGDRVCYHGICDMFRNKKLAADVYSVYSGCCDILNVSSTMDMGEHPSGNMGRVYIFSNADSVRMYKNGSFIKEYEMKSTEFPHLSKPPVEIDDHIGDQLRENEGFSKKRADYAKDILNESARFGAGNISPGTMMKAAFLRLKYGMTEKDAYSLYSRYIGNWGDKAKEFRFEAVKNGKVVKSVIKAPFESLALDVAVSSNELIEDSTYDVASVRIKVTDQSGNVLPFYNGMIKAKTKGEIDLIGPEYIIIRGGMGGTFVRTTGKAGKGELILKTGFSDKTEIDFNIIKK